MTTALELLAECHARQINLQALGGQLDIDAPAGELTPELLQRLRDCKAELLAMLQALGADGPQDLPGGDPLGADGCPDLAGDWQEYIAADGRLGWVRADVAGLEYRDWPGPTARRLMDEARRLRARYPVPDAELPARPVAPVRTWPAAVPSGIVADPVIICSGCGRLRVVPGQPGRPSGLCFGCWILSRKGR